MKESLIKLLLFDFFDGKTTSIQRKLIEEWLSDLKNQEIYYKYLDEWESERPQFSPDDKSAFIKFRTILDGEARQRIYSLPVETEKKYLWSRKWVRAAAAACFIALTCLVFKKQILYKSYESAIGKTATYQLSEGTLVTLNANSTLLVPRFGFEKNTRKVYLNGEAEFKVTHTEHHDKFIVVMGKDYQIEVLGTEFVAFSRARGKRVFLKEGKVKLTLPAGKQLYMKPGNLFVSTPAGKFDLVDHVADPRPYVGWKDQVFYFNNTRLSDVALQIQEQFDVKVRIADTLLANKRIAGIYKAEQADDLLQILSELMQIEITKKEDFIELSTPKLP